MTQTALRPESYTKKVALVLQGGGALGSYQAGVYEALGLVATTNLTGSPASRSERSMAALIAGNSPECGLKNCVNSGARSQRPRYGPYGISDLVNGRRFAFRPRKADQRNACADVRPVHSSHRESLPTGGSAARRPATTTRTR